MADADNGVMPENRPSCNRIQSRDYRVLSQPERAMLRQQYAVEQQGMCAHCDAPLAGPPPSFVRNSRINWRLFPGGKSGFLRYPVHLHHDHKTGMTIGAVHAHCNAHLWAVYGE